MKITKLDKIIRKNLYHISRKLLFQYDRMRFKSSEINLWPDILGSLAPEERWLLYGLAKDLQGESTILEIGVFGGLSTYFLGKGARSSSSQVYSIDPFDSEIKRQKESDSGEGAFYLQDGFTKPSESDVRKLLRECDLDDIVTLICGFSQDVEWNLPIDMLWVDGNHAYNSVIDDIDKFTSYLRVGGTAAFHDSVHPYGKEGTVKAVDERIRNSSQWRLLGEVHSITYAQKTGDKE